MNTDECIYEVDVYPGGCWCVVRVRKNLTNPKYIDVTYF